VNIVTVSFSRLYNLGNYENEKIEATALVQDNDAETTLNAIRVWVDVQHMALQQGREEQGEQQRAMYQRENYLKELENDINKMMEKWSEAKAWLEKLGIPLPYLYAKHEVSGDDVPF